MFGRKPQQIRVRFAPSPTGPLHIGGAKTMLFNWLFAKNKGGVLILRIEDTDVTRSQKKYEKDIMDGLLWLGLDWDEGPYRQSERIDIYEQYLKKLLEENKAYYCFCTKEELEAERQTLLTQGLAPKYSGKCRGLTIREIKQKIRKRLPSVVRLKVSDEEISFTDLIRGKIVFNTNLLGDIVIARNLRSPLYNFTAVVDDALMAISHIIRGDEHLSNTPKQILLIRALGFNEPDYAHLPLILAPDRSKLSKRHLVTSLNDYKKTGYLPEAMINFLALLGWHPIEDRETITKEELIREFSLERVQKAGAVFNLQKLDWFNAYYIRQLEDEELTKRLIPFVKPLDWAKNQEFLTKVAAVEKIRLKKLSDFSNLASFFFKLPAYQKNLLIWREQTSSQTILILKEAENIFSSILDLGFKKETLEQQFLPLIQKEGRGEVLWPLRVALSGQEASPGPFEIAEVLGKEEVIKRVRIAIRKLSF